MGNQSIQIGPFSIGDGLKPVIIAEIGVNHNGSVELAKELIVAAKNTGADIVKFQTFKAENLAAKDTPKVDYQKKNASNETESHFEMLKKLELSYADTKMLKEFCEHENILFMSTPYDIEGVEFLDSIGTLAFKGASADLVDYRLQEAMRKTGKPIIQSVGMTRIDELELFLQQYPETYPLILLQCTSNYPSDPRNSNLNTIKMMREKYGILSGFSDHTPNSLSAVLSVAAGACVIERHFTLDCTMDGPDHKASTEPGAFKAYVDEIQEAYEIMGRAEKVVAEEEMGMRRVSRKGVYLKRDVSIGENLSDDLFYFRRPSTEVSPLELPSLMDKVFNCDIKCDSALKREYFEN